jgi:hypothetical protein
MSREIDLAGLPRRQIGADDDDIATWTEACEKRFVERIVSHINRLGS